MKLTRWKWVYNNRQEVTHTHTVSREKGWKEVEFAPDEKVYWTGHPERVWLRWEMLFCPLAVAVFCAASVFYCYLMMKQLGHISVGCLGPMPFAVTFSIPIFKIYGLKSTTYIFTDRRIIVENARWKYRSEYDLASYLKDFGGMLFPTNRRMVWQPGNRWDATLMWSSYHLAQANWGLGVEFKSLPEDVYDILRRAGTEIRLKYRTPAPSPFNMKIVRTGVCDMMKRKKQLKQVKVQAAKRQ